MDRYDEALAKARAGKSLEEIFPEMNESEDERLRKLLVWQVHRNIEDETNDLAGSVYDGIKGHDPDLEESIEDWKKCLAYLEKQKEAELTEEDKKIIPEALVMLCDDIINHRVHTPIRTNEEGARKIKTFLKTINRQPHKSKEEWEKQKEQKPAECGDDVVEEAEEYTSKVACGEYGVEVTEAYIAGVLSERNRGTEWSEEDEKMLRTIISDGIRGVELDSKQIAWLKSLRPQPKDETYKEKNEAFRLGKHNSQSGL